LALFSLLVAMMGLVTASFAGVALRASTGDSASSLAHSLLFPEHTGAMLGVLAVTALVVLVRWFARGEAARPQP
jgi:hypothetical protein